MKTIYAKVMLLCMVLNQSCNSGTEHSSTASSFNHSTKSLGNIYKSIEDSYLDANCIKGEEFISSESTPKKISYRMNSTFDDLSKELSVSSKLSGNYFTVKGDTSLNWAVDQQVTNTDQTHSFIWQAVKGRRKYVTNTVGLDHSILTNGQKEKLKNDPKKIYEFCGDGFISEIEYGSSLLVSLRFQFLTESDKNEFNQKINLEYNGGTFGIKGNSEVNKLSDRVKETGRVILEAQQIGGTDTGLLDLISEQMPSCSVKNLSQCMEVMNGVLQYAQRLKVEFDETSSTDDIAGKWDAIGYTVTDYESIRKPDAYNFFNVELPKVSYPFMSLRNTLIEEWIGNRTILSEAQRFEYASGISSTSSDLIEIVIKRSEENEALLDDLQVFCYSSSYEKCLAEWELRSTELNNVELEFKLLKKYMDSDSQRGEMCKQAEARLTSHRGDSKKLLDSALYGPKRERLSVKGNHWNMSKIKSYSVDINTVSVRGQIIRSIKGLSDDKMDFSCTWGMGGKISMSKKIDYNNGNRGWESAAIDIAGMICQQVFDQYFLMEKKCNRN